MISISKHNSIKVIAEGGDAVLGGDIFDTELFQEIFESYKSEGGNIQNDVDKKLFILKNEI